MPLQFAYMIFKLTQVMGKSKKVGKKHVLTGTEAFVSKAKMMVRNKEKGT